MKAPDMFESLVTQLQEDRAFNLAFSRSDLLTTHLPSPWFKTITTPVPEPCKFLAMATRESECGVPAGVVQECCHPAHRENMLLQKNLEEILVAIRELLTESHIRRELPALLSQRVVIVPAEALDLPNPATYEETSDDLLLSWTHKLESLCVAISQRMEASRKVEGPTNDEKGFTRDFDNKKTARHPRKNTYQPIR